MKQNIIIGLLVVGIIILIFRSGPVKPVNVTKYITGKETEVIKIEKQIVPMDRDVARLDGKIDELIEKRKNERDTVLIIQTLDTTVSVLIQRGKKQDSIRAALDQIITLKNDIIKSKDTMISLKDDENIQLLLEQDELTAKIKRKNKWIVRSGIGGAIIGFVGGVFVK